MLRKIMISQRETEKGGEFPLTRVKLMHLGCEVAVVLGAVIVATPGHSREDQLFNLKEKL